MPAAIATCRRRQPNLRGVCAVPGLPRLIRNRVVDIPVKTQLENSAPPRVPPVALELADDGGEFIRHLAARIAGLSSSEAAALLNYLRALEAPQP